MKAEPMSDIEKQYIHDKELLGWSVSKISRSLGRCRRTVAFEIDPSQKAKHQRTQGIWRRNKYKTDATYRKREIKRAGVYHKTHPEKHREAQRRYIEKKE